MALGIVFGFLGSRTSNRGGRRRCHKFLLGLAAIAAFLLALPAAALACVSAGACTAGGGIVIVFGGHNVCSGGAQAGQNICSGGASSQALQMQMSAIGPISEIIKMIQDQENKGHLEDDEGLLWAINWIAGLQGAGPNANININNPEEQADQAEAQYYEQQIQQLMHPHPLGGPVSFSMYSSNGVDGPYAGGDIFSVHNNGYRLSDSAGAIAPGSLAPGYNSLGGGGGFDLKADGTPLIGFYGNQRLMFDLNLDYQNLNTNYGTSALTPGLSSAGSARSDFWALTGSATYMRNFFYASGSAAYNWFHSGITNNTDGGTGSTNGQGYNLGAAAGYMFPLFNTTGATPPMMPTKAPPPPRYGGYLVFLDVSGHAGYQDLRDNGFTDSTGFIFGTERESFTDLGAAAKLIGIVPAGGLVWMPYVGLGVDQELGFSHTWDFPAQAATPADTVFVDQSKTFWTVNAGLNILNRASVKAGVSAFYSASADTNIIGGNVFLKIPFYPDPPSSAASGIREAKSN